VYPRCGDAFASLGVFVECPDVQMFESRLPCVLPCIVVFNDAVVEVIVWICGAVVVVVVMAMTAIVEYWNDVLIIFGRMMCGYGDGTILTHVGR